MVTLILRRKLTAVREFLLGMQYLSIIGIFLEAVIIFMRMKTPLHSYLFVSCIAALAVNVGYLLELKAVGEDEYIAALKFSYAGRVWYAFFLFLFIARLCRKRLPRILVAALVLIHVISYSVILNLKGTNLYYTYMKYDTTGIFPRLYHGNGIFHHITMGMVLFYIIIGIVLLLRSYKKEKDASSRQRLLTVITAVLVEAVFFVAQLVGAKGIAYSFDFTMFGYFFGTLIMLIAILSFDLLGTKELAKEYIIDRISEGIIAPDEIGDYTKRYNEIREKEFVYRELFDAPDARILVVDDTEMNFTVITGLLKNTGIRIDCAMSGRDALTLAAVNNYDAIFIDHMMPDMDGIETLKELREIEKNAKTPAVALTANAVSGARQMYLDAGFDDYISKPVDGIRLEKMLLSMLPKDKIKSPAGDDPEDSADAAAAAPTILVVDDSKEIHELVRGILGQSYKIEGCFLGKEAFSLAKKLSPDLILLDIYLPDENGFEVMSQLGLDERTRDIPVLMITGDGDSITEENGFKSGAADYIRKPFEPEVLKARIKHIIDLSRYQRSIEDEVQKQTKKTSRLSREIMLTLSKAVDIKDHYTEGHSRRVAALSAEIARRLGKTPAEQVEQYEIGLLHDIGKIGIHEDIIHKTSRLTDDEFIQIKEHTLKGYEILKEIEDMPKLWEGARWHHERFDGTGYPDGLAGENIPEAARIVCAADCYDAMTSTRTYSVPKRQEDVRAEIVRCSGTWFDPRVAEALLSMIDEDVDYHMNEQSDGSDVWKEYDRLWKNDTARRTRSEDSSSFNLPGWLRQIPEIEVDAGIKNCGSAEGYMSVLSVFHQTAPDKAREIQEFFEAKDLENYTIRVHALKSSARIIGAAALSKLSEGLEKAGKQRDAEYINANTGRLLQMFRQLNDKLSALDEKKGEKPLIDGESLADAFSTIIEIAGSMDYGLMEGIIADLKGYSLPEADERRLKDIEKSLTELDWDEIIRIARKGPDTTAPVAN